MFRMWLYLFIYAYFILVSSILFWGRTRKYSGFTSGSVFKEYFIKRLESNMTSQIESGKPYEMSRIKVILAKSKENSLPLNYYFRLGISLQSPRPLINFSTLPQICLFFRSPFLFIVICLRATPSGA